MDNLTHSLVGAILGQMGLKRKTGLAMPTLIVAANIPDIDAVAVLLGGHQHLAIRRGITHGPIAMVLLPVLLWAAMLWFDRWQRRRGTRPEKRLPVDRKWLLILSFIGCLSHPLFDWFNSYGIRLLEPFSSQWFYGDTLFIIDIWIWAALIAGVWLSLRRERRGLVNWTRPAWMSFTAICAYIFANGLITVHAEGQALAQLRERHDASASMPDPLVVANAVPVTFWKREILWRDGAFYGDGSYSIGQSTALKDVYRDVFPDLDTKRLQQKDTQLRAFLFWSRMPVIQEDKDGGVFQRDLRFLGSPAGNRFEVKLGTTESLGIAKYRKDRKNRMKRSTVLLPQ